MHRPVLIALVLAGCAGPQHFEARYDPALAARMQRAEIEGFDLRVCDAGPEPSPQAEAADSMLAASATDLATTGDSVERTAKQHPAASFERAQDARRCEVARALAQAPEPVLSASSQRPAYRAIRISPGRFEFVRLEKTATGATLAWRLEVAGAPRTGTAVLGADASASGTRGSALHPMTGRRSRSKVPAPAAMRSTIRTTPPRRAKRWSRCSGRSSLAMAARLPLLDRDGDRIEAALARAADARQRRLERSSRSPGS
jgi:hypothetical protein